MPKARAVTGRRNPTPKARGSSWEEQPHIQGVVAVQAQEGLEDPSHVEGQQGRQEEIPFIQRKEQWLCFAGGREEIPHTQGKRNPRKMVGFATRHERADTLKPYSQKMSQSNYTRTIALSN